VILVIDGSTSFASLEWFIEVQGASGGSRSSNSAKIGQRFPLFVHKPAQNSKQTKTKDAQKHLKVSLDISIKTQKNV
jgi:hypothetical protein